MSKAEWLRARIEASVYYPHLMPRPICGSCSSDEFGMEKLLPKGAAHPVNVVKCLKCGTVQGIVPLEEATTLIREQSELIRRLGRYLEVDLDMGKK